MAEVYLATIISKDLTLASRICDVVSAGISPITPDQKLNPKKLERLFKTHDMLKSWPQKQERRLAPEDVVEFDYILLLNGADSEAPYAVWAEDNPDEAEEIKAAAGEGEDWRANFKTKILDLSVFTLRTEGAEEQSRQSFMDPVQPGQGPKFGVKFQVFEEKFTEIRKAVDGWLAKELRYSVEEMKFMKSEKRKGLRVGREGAEATKTPVEDAV